MDNRFKRIHEILEKSKYGNYYDKRYIAGMPPRCGKSVFQQGLNCSDEVVPGSNERTRRIRRLMHEKVEINPQSSQKVSKIISEMRSLMKEEFMELTGRSEHEADHFLDTLVYFNHFKKHVATDGKEYLSIDPKIEPKSEGVMVIDGKHIVIPKDAEFSIEPIETCPLNPQFKYIIKKKGEDNDN